MTSAPDEGPAFAWRGLLLDVCRHWIGPDGIVETIDAMAAARLNVLHLHLTDDQAFRLESRAHPGLHRSGSDGRYLRRDDIRRIVDHAAGAGIRVVPEIDLPGHVTSWLVAYPHLAATPGPFERRRTLGIADCALDPANPEVDEVVADVLAEVAGLFDDECLHIGGDEVAAAARPGLDVAVEQRRFTDRICEMVRGLRRTPMVWDEAWHPDLPTDVVVQVWRGHRRLRAAVATGHRVVFSSPYYLDLGYDPVHHHVSPLVGAAGWAEARRALHGDPRLGVWAPLVEQLDDEFEGDGPAPDEVVDPSLVLGGEAAMWTELVTADSLHLRLWPGLAAVADVLWSGGRAPRDEVHDRVARVMAEVGAVVDVDARRRGWWWRLASGDAALSDALVVLAEVCEPAKWYARHALLPGQRLDVPFDRFVDGLAPAAAAPVRPDGARWAAAARTVAAAAAGTDADPRIAELAPVASHLAAVAGGGHEGGPVAPGSGEIVVVARLG